MEENKFICPFCEQEIDECDIVCARDTNNFACIDCAQSNWEWCHDCEEYYENTEMYYTHYDYSVCDSCVSNNYFYCEDCEEYWHNDEACYSESENEDYCPNCICNHENNNINGYHNGDHGFELLGEGELRFGFEIEVNAPYSYYNIDYAAGVIRNKMGMLLFDIQEDGSIPHGFEIITNPMTWDYYQEHKHIIEDALTYLKDEGFDEFGDNCGVHIHFTKEPVENANKMYYEELNFILETFDTKVKNIARRDTIYDGGYLGDRVKDGKKVKWNKLIETLDKGKRYQLINIRPLYTFEWRIFKGTTNFNVLEEYITMAYNITMAVKNNKFLGKTFSELSGIKDDDKTRLNGLAREIRYAKLIGQVVDECKRDIILMIYDRVKSETMQNDINLGTFGNEEIVITKMNREYIRYRDFLQNFINGNEKTTITRMNQYIDNNLSVYDVLYNKLLEIISQAKTKLAKLENARDYVSQQHKNKPTIEDLKVGKRVRLIGKKGVEHIVKAKNFYIDDYYVENFSGKVCEISSVNANLSTVQLNWAQWFPIETISEIVKEER